ncbi:MAG: hypothetical protein IRY99_21105, partial [Isosphaeraceae bacterium]|nr:hypothetical protein [Isosphaeraceae bacterium]
PQQQPAATSEDEEKPSYLIGPDGKPVLGPDGKPIPVVSKEAARNRKPKKNFNIDPSQIQNVLGRSR